MIYELYWQYILYTLDWLNTKNNLERSLHESYIKWIQLTPIPERRIEGPTSFSSIVWKPSIVKEASEDTVEYSFTFFTDLKSWAWLSWWWVDRRRHSIYLLPQASHTDQQTKASESQTYVGGGVPCQLYRGDGDTVTHLQEKIFTTNYILSLSTPVQSR